MGSNPASPTTMTTNETKDHEIVILGADGEEICVLSFTEEEYDLIVEAALQDFIVKVIQRGLDSKT